MELTDEQKGKVREWIASGSKLSEIQERLSKEYDLHLLYMDVRLLVDDLQITPRETVEPEPVKPADPAPESGMEPDEPLGSDPLPTDPLAAAAAGGKATVTVDQITKPGAMVSGSATFGDGKTAGWYLDQYGRFGLVPPEPGYRPSEADLAKFQTVLDVELRKLGY